MIAADRRGRSAAARVTGLLAGRLGLLGFALLRALRLNRSAEQSGELGIFGLVMLFFGRLTVLISRLRRLTVVR